MHPEHTPEEEKKIREAALDETVEATFPASDPASTIPNPDEDEVLEKEDGPAKAGPHIEDADPYIREGGPKVG